MPNLADITIPACVPKKVERFAWEAPPPPKRLGNGHDPMGDCDCPDCTAKSMLLYSTQKEEEESDEALDRMAVRFVLDAVIDFFEELRLTGRQLQQAGQLLRDIEALRKDL